jgi:hypothetical protein
MCHHRQSWESLDIQTILELADTYNAALPGDTDQKVPSTTTLDVSKGLGSVGAGGPFGLFVTAILFSFFGCLAFWAIFIDGKGHFAIIVVVLGAILEVAGAFWLRSMTETVTSRVEAIDPQYARNPALSRPFQGLFWSATAASIIMGFAALFQLPIARQIAHARKKRERRDREIGGAVLLEERAGHGASQQEYHKIDKIDAPQLEYDEIGENDPPPAYEEESGERSTRSRGMTSFLQKLIRVL